MPEGASRIYSRGTTLAEVPPEFRGISWREFEALQWSEWKASVGPRKGPAEIESKRFATARDRYGWRGLRGGGAVSIAQRSLK